MGLPDEWFAEGEDDGTEGGGRADEGARGEAGVRSGGRRAVVAAGVTAAVALGALGAGAVVVTGLGGADVLLARADSPAPPPGGSGEVDEPGAGAEDAYLASLAAPTETPEPPPPPPEPVDVPEPVVRVVPLDPGESFDDDDDPWAVAYEIPDLPGAWEAALPDGLLPFEPMGQYRSTVTVPGQSCNGSGGTGAVAGQWWSWAEELSNRFDQTTAGVVVTGWPTGAASGALADVAQDDGLCSWLGDVPRAVDVDVPSADEAWAGQGASTGTDLPPATYGAARTGDLVVGVELRGAPAGRAAEQVGALLEAVVVELREADPGGAAG